MPNFIDLTGQTFGKLTVAGLFGVKNRRTYFKCRCNCGKEIIVRSDHLKSGRTRSCGCLLKESMAKFRGIKRPDVSTRLIGENNPCKRQEVKEKIRKTLTGRKRPELSGEKNPAKKMENRIKISEAKKGKKQPNISKSKLGCKNPAWKESLTQEERAKNKNRYSDHIYKDFVKYVRMRDNNTCRRCGMKSSRNMRVHQLNSYKFDKENRFNPDNAVLLCSRCHDIQYDGSFHNIYGRNNNTKEQFEEFMSKYLS